MSETRQNDELLYELFVAQVEERITPAQHDELEALLLGSTAARELYVDLIAQHSELTRIHRGLGPWGDFDLPSLDLNASLLADAKTGFGGRLRRIFGSSRYSGFVAASAVLVLLCCGLAFSVIRDSQNRRPVEVSAAHEGVARLVGSNEAVWEGDAPSDAAISAGQRLVLRSGLAELRYKTGCLVILEGPVDFTVGRKEKGSIAPPSNSGYLARGKLLAWVNDANAKGFTVDVPGGSVEDLGTEFAIHVQDDGVSDVVVLNGSVHLRGNSKTKNGVARRLMRLATGQAASVAKSGVAIKRHHVVDYRFVSNMNNRLAASRDEHAARGSETALIAHWKLDGNAKDAVGSHHGKLHGNTDFAKGRMGGAAKFDGNGDFITTGTDPFPETEFTASAWVLPETPAPAERMYVLGTQQSGNRGSFLTVGRRGALSLVFPGPDSEKVAASVSNAVPVRQWTHVAMTVSSTEGARLYENGNLVAIETTMTSQLSIDNFTIGKRPDKPPARSGKPPQKSDYRYWKGLIDDVAVWKGVLTPGQLRNVARRGAQHFDDDTASAVSTN